MLELLEQLFTDYTLRTVASGAALIGAVSGALGTFAVLRRQSLLGDAVSHAALPGIVLAFLLTGSKASIILILGAAVTGWLATLLVMSITSTTRIEYDSALALILSVFFGFGLVLLTFLQKMPYANQAGLDTFLFGQASSLVQRDVLTMLILGGIAFGIAMLLWKEFKMLSFDADFGNSIGLPVRRLDIILTSLLVVAIVIGLQTVGVVLMSAMIVAAPVAARQWTDRLGIMVLLAMAMGALSGVTGAVLSASTHNLPTGPTIVLCISALVVLSMMVASNRGMVWRLVRRWRSGRRFKQTALLLDLYALAQQHQEYNHPHSEATLATMCPHVGALRHHLRMLADKGLVQCVTGNKWVLTRQGFEEVERILQSHKP